MSEMQTRPRAYSVRRLADEWDCPPKTIYNMIDRGELAAFMLGEKRGWRVPANEVDRWERENLKSTAAETAPSEDEAPVGLSSTEMRALANG